jgi:hypothetical protein
LGRSGIDLDRRYWYCHALSKLTKMAPLLEGILFAGVTSALVWQACNITGLVFDGLREEEEELPRRRKQYAEEARRAWANGVNLDEARGTFWQSLFRDGRSRP